MSESIVPEESGEKIPEGLAALSTPSGLSSAHLPPRLLVYYDRPGFLVRRAHQCSISSFMEDLRTVGITPTQLSSLAVLVETPGIDQITLARRIGVDRTTISMVVGGLVRHGFIHRRKSASDARRNELVPTVAGRAGFRLAQSIAGTNRDEILSAFLPDEAERLTEHLRTIAMGVDVEVAPWVKPDGSTRFGNEAELAKRYPEHCGLYTAFGFILRRCHQVLDALFIEECGEFRLTARKFSVIFMASHFEAVEQVTLARLVGLDTSTTATIVSEIAGRGWLSRSPHDNDRRRRVIRLEPAGRLLLKQIHPCLARIERRTLEPLGDDADGFIRLMKKLVVTNNTDTRVPMNLPFTVESSAILAPSPFRERRRDRQAVG